MGRICMEKLWFESGQDKLGRVKQNTPGLTTFPDAKNSADRSAVFSDLGPAPDRRRHVDSQVRSWDIDCDLDNLG